MIRSTVIPVEENENLYCVSFGDGHGFNVEAQRSLQAFNILHDNLLATSYLPAENIPFISFEPVPDVLHLQNFLNFWLRFYNESAPISDILINFIEDVQGQADVTHLQFSVLRQKVGAPAFIVHVQI